MLVLWDRGEASVGDVVQALKERPKPAYNTVLTLLRILERKGYVTHRKDDGVALRLIDQFVIFEALVFVTHFPFIGVALTRIAAIGFHQRALTV